MTEQPGPPPPPPGSERVPAPPPAPPVPPAHAAQPLVPGGQPPEPRYVTKLDIGYQEEYSRFLPLIKWLLAIPHYFALFFVGIGGWFAIVYAFFAVLFTGRWPEGAFNYVVGVVRWASRVNAYLLYQVDAYPPFSLDDDPSYPVRVQIEYPRGEIARWRPLLHWLMVIPYAICTYGVLIAAYACSFIGFFTILFTKRFPRGLFDIVTVGERWLLRQWAYQYWMTERYPPFVWG